ncbi:MAG: hypothetical protein NT154_20480 [Verrucomicrobia bacterium]|nr:hypothetical protein [Verrucomicrobiota bacterium]
MFVNGVPKLADIGLVTGVDATRSYVGTEGFAAPEGPGSPQGDLYSLGKVLYEAATGKDRQEFPELPTHLRELPDRDGLMELNAVIARACRHNPKDRYISAASMRADLELLQSGKSLARLHRTEAQLRFVQWAGAVVTAVAALAAGLYLWQARQTRLVRELAGEKTRLAEANHRLVMTHEEQLIRANSARGVQYLEADDPAAALPWLVETLERVEARHPKQAELHRLRLGTVLRYHPRLLSVTPISAPVRTLAFSPDGRWFAAGSEEGQVLIVDAQQSTVYRSLVHHGSVHSVEFSQDSRRLLTACEDGLARLWSIEDTNEPVLFPHRAAVRYATFSPDAELVLTASADRTARLWRAADGQPVGKPLEHSMPLFHASFSPNGRIIATGSGNRNDLGKSHESGEFSLWDRDTGNRIAPPITLRAASTWTAFSPDGTRAASSCGEAFFDLRISRPGVLVETATAKVIRKLEHIDRITHVAFSPDGKRLASAALGYEVMVGDAVTGEPLIRRETGACFASGILATVNRRFLPFGA